MPEPPWYLASPSDQTPALGTLFYMAPEQADLTSSPDVRWDVYAMGAIMYRMLTGKAPYRDESFVQQLDTAGSLKKRLQRYRESIVSSPPPEAHLECPGVDRALARIVSKCLNAKPEDRYSNVQQILQDLTRRDATRAKRPLMLLGIVGPLLVLLATCFFGYRSIDKATQSTLAALRTEAKGSNELAATFAAKTLENEINRYFQVTKNEAHRPAFIEQLEMTLEAEKVATALQQIAALGTPSQTHGSTLARADLLELEQQNKLNALLQIQLARYTKPDTNSRQPRLASMFVTDNRGTIIGIAYQNTEDIRPEENSVGKNFSYRTYFHGGRVDKPKQTTRISESRPITSTHLSAAFQSTATGLWKVAISTPLYLSNKHFSNKRSDPDAIFVTTVNLGDIELLQTEEASDQIAVLVESREDRAEGTILQHPLMDAQRVAGVKSGNKKYQIDRHVMHDLLTGRIEIYKDPLADNTKLAKGYNGEWIASVHPVKLPLDEDDEETQFRQSTESETLDPPPPPTELPEGAVSETDEQSTDLVVLVQYRLETVNAPVFEMQSALLREGVLAIISILAVTLTLWFFVKRVGRPYRKTRARLENPKSKKTVTDNPAKTITLR